MLSEPRLSAVRIAAPPARRVVVGAGWAPPSLLCWFGLLSVCLPVVLLRLPSFWAQQHDRSASHAPRPGPSPLSARPQPATSKQPQALSPQGTAAGRRRSFALARAPASTPPAPLWLRDRHLRRACSARLRSCAGSTACWWRRTAPAAAPVRACAAVLLRFACPVGVQSRRPFHATHPALMR